jgi:chorismate binding enzyme
VLSQRFSRRSGCRFLDLGSFAVAGSSPEILVRVREGTVTIRPLAGTRPRGATPAEDKALCDRAARGMVRPFHESLCKESSEVTFGAGIQDVELNPQVFWPGRCPSRGNLVGYPIARSLVNRNPSAQALTVRTFGTRSLTFCPLARL